MFGTSGRVTLKFSSEPAFYLPLVKTSWEGTFLQNYSPFIYEEFYKLKYCSTVVYMVPRA